MSAEFSRSPKGRLAGLIFWSRWLQLPIYLGLIVVQGVYSWKFLSQLYELLVHLGQLTETEIMLTVLGLIDVVMIANLLLMVTVGGYETFVSRLRVDHHPDQPERREVLQQPAEDDRGDRHPGQEHDVKQRDDLRPGLVRRPVRGEREPRGLGHVQAKPGHQEGDRRQRLARPGRAQGLVARQHDQREGHHRQPAHLPERAEPQVGNALPADGRAVGVGPEAEQRPERRDQDGQRDHHRHHHRRHRQLDDHHPVQRAQQHDRGHPDRDLEQRQAQDLSQRQRVRGRVREGQEAGGDAGQGGGSRAGHRRTSSACEM